MNVSFSLPVNGSIRYFSYEIDTIRSPFIPISYVDPRSFRPYVFHDFSIYVYEEVPSFNVDFQKMVRYANSSTKISTIDKLKDALKKIVDDHIRQCNRIIFNDLLMYVDCMAYMCLGSRIKTEYEVRQEYASWAKMIVDSKINYVQAAVKWGPTTYKGSQNEKDLLSAL